MPQMCRFTRRWEDSTVAHARAHIFYPGFMMERSSQACVAEIVGFSSLREAISSGSLF